MKKDWKIANFHAVELLAKLRLRPEIKTECSPFKVLPIGLTENFATKK